MPRAVWHVLRAIVGAAEQRRSANIMKKVYGRRFVREKGHAKAD